MHKPIGRVERPNERGWSERSSPKKNPSHSPGNRNLQSSSNRNHKESRLADRMPASQRHWCSLNEELQSHEAQEQQLPGMKKDVGEGLFRQASRASRCKGRHLKDLELANVRKVRGVTKTEEIATG